jgi:protein O-GlcNAc transferase
VQVTHFGYPDTTGMTQMDYRISDALADPVGSAERFYTEKLIRLPHVGWLYGTPEDAPEVGPLPAQSKGHITFGSFNAFAKVGPKVFALWARILQAVPGSKILLLTYTGPSAPRVDEYCAAYGIARERILTIGRVPRAKYLEFHNGVDIALDPFPYNGAITTSDALWMGVPVVSLEGDRYLSRQGLTVLTNVGLPELVAKTTDDYVKIAVDLANDLPRLSALRAGLRQRMRQSPLGDAAQFVANLQTAYRQMWRQWATGG